MIFGSRPLSPLHIFGLVLVIALLCTAGGFATDWVTFSYLTNLLWLLLMAANSFVRLLFDIVASRRAV